MHSLLSLPVNTPFKELSSSALSFLQDRFRHCKLLIFDEKSMIGFRTLYRVDHRLRAIRARPDEFFGGMNILFCGDFGQLPPVAEHPLYSNPEKVSIEVLGGQQAYAAFNETVALTEIMRQQGDSPSARQFREVLSQLRDGPISPENWRFLLTRCKENLTHKAWMEFDDALRLYARKEDTAAYNLHRLRQLAKPVIEINAVHTGPGAKEASSDDAGLLQPELLLCKGSRMMLTWNMWTDQGLVNGSMGTVFDIVWDDDVEDPFKTLPAVILMAMDNYTGPASFEIDGLHLVPITPKLSNWINKGQVCTRQQLPLILSPSPSIKVKV